MKCLKLSAVLVFCLLTACSSIGQYMSSKMLEADWYRLQPAEQLGKAIDATHVVVATIKGEVFSSINQVEWNNERVAIAAFGHLGGPLFSLVYQDETLDSNVSKMLPSYFNPGFVLRDYQLIFLPIEKVQQGFKNGSLTITESDLKRTIYENEQTLVTIEYEYNDPWLGKAELTNHKRDYSLSFSLINNE